MKKPLIAAVVIVLLSVIQSHARPGDPFTQYGCGRNTVSAGDPADKVIAYCGNPTSIQNREQANIHAYNRNTASVNTHTIEYWTYNFGPRGGMVQMIFRDGVLQAIKDKGAGY